MTDTAAAPKTKLVAGLLGIFLGSIGVHKFYLGDNKAGNIRIGVHKFYLGDNKAGNIRIVVHKFYLGDNKAGNIRIVVTVVTVVTFGIGGLWGFIEGIMLLANGGKDVNGVELV